MPFNSENPSFVNESELERFMVKAKIVILSTVVGLITGITLLVVSQ